MQDCPRRGLTDIIFEKLHAVVRKIFQFFGIEFFIGQHGDVVDLIGNKLFHLVV